MNQFDLSNLKRNQEGSRKPKLSFNRCVVVFLKRLCIRAATLKLWVAIQWGVANIRCVGRKALQKMQKIDWLFLFSAVSVCGSLWSLIIHA